MWTAECPRCAVASATMPLQGVLRGRRSRTLLLGAGAIGWLIAVIGALLGNRAILGVGLGFAGLVSVVALKLLMEIHSVAVRRAQGGRHGTDPSAARSSLVGGSANRSNSLAFESAHGRLELYTDRTISQNAELVGVVRQALIEHHFSKLTGWTDETGLEYYRVDLDRHTFQRHDAAVTYIVPWVNQAIPLAGASVVEIGCGTGSSTAAFAAYADIVHGYDISPSSIDAAKVRLEAHGFSDRVDLVLSAPAELLATVEARHVSAPVDVVLLYALLEHQTIDERIETLRLAQTILRPGGIIVVIETPNRLTYFDRHTSQLPFFQMLPIDHQLLYADRSPRTTFADNIAAHRERSPGEDALRALTIRWGQSVTFHDFEVAIGDVNQRIVSSGLHPNLMKIATGAARGAATARVPAQHGPLDPSRVHQVLPRPDHRRLSRGRRTMRRAQRTARLR